MPSLISRRLGSKHPDNAWRKPRHAKMFNNERGHGEVHNPEEYPERFQFGSYSNRSSKAIIQSKRHQHSLSNI